MAIENSVNRRNSTDLRDAKGVNYDLEKIKNGLSSEVIDVPKQALLHKDLKDNTTLIELNSSDDLGMRTT